MPVLHAVTLSPEVKATPVPRAAISSRGVKAMPVLRAAISSPGVKATLVLHVAILNRDAPTARRAAISSQRASKARSGRFASGLSAEFPPGASLLPGRILTQTH
jgi:hypothetical protein